MQPKWSVEFFIKPDGKDTVLGRYFGLSLGDPSSTPSCRPVCLVCAVVWSFIIGGSFAFWAGVVYMVAQHL